MIKSSRTVVLITVCVGWVVGGGGWLLKREREGLYTPGSAPDFISIIKKPLILLYSFCFEASWVSYID